MPKIASVTAAAALLFAAPHVAQARKSPLTGAPDVRDKYELRLARFEVTPTFEFTPAADYKNTLGFGAKLEYHLTDSLSFGGILSFGVASNTALESAIAGSLPDLHAPGDPTPTAKEFEDHLNTMPFHGGVHATFTPWFGKIALFGKAYVAFDVYLSGGLGFAQLKTNFGKDYCSPVADGMDAMGNPTFTDPRNDCPYNSGTKLGIEMAAGMHVFFNKFVALDIGFRNYMFNDNPSGQDFNADGKVNGDDPRFLSHLFFGLGVSFYLPPKAKITH
jgi:outer membrane beta-barrel protein